MRKTKYILFFVLFNGFAFGQNAIYIDSLSKQLTIVKIDSTIAYIKNELAYELRNSNTPLALQYAKEAFEISSKKNCDCPKEMANSLVRLGTVFLIKGDLNKAEDFFNRAILTRTKLKEIKGVINLYNNLGLVKKNQGKYTEAKKYYQKGLKLCDNFPSTKAAILNNIGDICTKQETYQEAIVFFDQALTIRQKQNDSLGMANILLNQAFLYLKLRNLNEAQKACEYSLTIFEGISNKNMIVKCYIISGRIHEQKKEYKQSLSFYDKALSFENKIGSKDFFKDKIGSKDFFEYKTNSKDLATLYRNKGIVHRELGDYSKSNSSLLKSLEIVKKSNSKPEIAELYYEIANLYKDQSLYQKACEYYLKSLSFIESNNFTKTQVLLNLASTYEILEKKDSAYHYSQAYNKLGHNIYIKKIDAINLQRNLEEEEKRSVQLATQLLEKTANLAQNQAQLTQESKIQLRNRMISIITFITGLSLFFIYRQYQKRQLAELETNQAYLEVDQLLNQQELKVAYARIESKDDTQKRIGEDLHDRLGAMLSTIKLYLADFSEQNRHLKIDLKQQDKATALLDEAVKEIRQISHDMQAGILKKYGLVSAINDLVDTINESNQIKVKIYAYGLKNRISDRIEINLYKITQELIGNILKHAQAKNITISITKQDGLISLIVEDDGVGFDTQKIIEKSGVGLKNITYRVSELNGKCHFDSGRGKGTSVLIDIPVEN